jgi:hypothetical protein
MLMLESDYLKAHPLEFQGKAFALAVAPIKHGGFMLAMASTTGAGTPQTAQARNLGACLEMMADAVSVLFTEPGSTADHLEDAAAVLRMVSDYVPGWIAMLEANSFYAAGGKVN